MASPLGAASDCKLASIERDVALHVRDEAGAKALQRHIDDIKEHYALFHSPDSSLGTMMEMMDGERRVSTLPRAPLHALRHSPRVLVSNEMSP